MTGFIAMQRDALDHPVLFDGGRFRAWFWLVANAAWKPTRTRIKGKIVTLERGEMTYSIRFLAENWGWSKSRVDRFLAELREEGMIETRSKSGTTAGHAAGQGQSIISVCNYAKYQTAEDRLRDNDEPEPGTTAGQQRDKEEQVNKIIPPKNARGSKLPEGWQPILTERSQRIVSAWPEGKLDRELSKFRNHAADKGRTSKDWQAAFRKWIDNADEWKPANDQRNSKPTGTATAAERARANFGCH